MVQLGVALVVLVALPSPVRPAVPVVVACGALGAVALVLVRRRHGAAGGPATGTSRWARAWRTARADLRDAVLARRAWPALAMLSLVVLAGHLAVFVVAARTVGVDAGLRVLLPLALLALVAAAVPANIGGWGPREGVAAWVFASAGLGVDRGVATATAFGVLVFVAGLPGALVLVAGAAAPPPADRRCRTGGCSPEPVRG